MEFLTKGTKKAVSAVIKEYLWITASTLLMVAGTYLFKFPNNFTFGGVSGLAVVLGKVTPFSPSASNFVINMALILLGFLFIGKSFGFKTVYSSMVLSFALSALDEWAPITQPLTDEPLLELVFAVAFPALGSAMLFNIGASSGGTDVIAMILKKYSNFNIGSALMVSDVLITVSAFFVFDVKTALFSVLGLVAKSLVVDNVIESINMCKYFNVVCADPEPICNFIVHKLDRSATIVEAQGAFSHDKKYIVFTALKRYQALALRLYIKNVEPGAFILISNTSEIIGKGFHS